MYLVCILYVTCILVSWRSTLTGSKPFTGIYQKSISHPQFIGRQITSHASCPGVVSFSNTKQETNQNIVESYVVQKVNKTFQRVYTSWQRYLVETFYYRKPPFIPALCLVITDLTIVLWILFWHLPSSAMSNKSSLSGFYLLMQPCFFCGVHKIVSFGCFWSCKFILLADQCR